MSDFGSRRCFQVMGIISGAIAVVYSALHYFWLRNKVVHPPPRRASVKSYPVSRNGKLLFNIFPKNSCLKTFMFRIRKYSLFFTIFSKKLLQDFFFPPPTSYVYHIK